MLILSINALNQTVFVPSWWPMFSFIHDYVKYYYMHKNLCWSIGHSFTLELCKSSCKNLLCCFLFMTLVSSILYGAASAVYVVFSSNEDYIIDYTVIFLHIPTCKHGFPGNHVISVKWENHYNLFNFGENYNLVD